MACSGKDPWKTFLLADAKPDEQASAAAAAAAAGTAAGDVVSSPPAAVDEPKAASKAWNGQAVEISAVASVYFLDVHGIRVTSSQQVLDELGISLEKKEALLDFLASVNNKLKDVSIDETVTFGDLVGCLEKACACTKTELNLSDLLVQDEAKEPQKAPEKLVFPPGEKMSPSAAVAAIRARKRGEEVNKGFQNKKKKKKRTIFF